MIGIIFTGLHPGGKLEQVLASNDYRTASGLLGYIPGGSPEARKGLQHLASLSAKLLADAKTCEDFKDVYYFYSNDGSLEETRALESTKACTRHMIDNVKTYDDAVKAYKFAPSGSLLEKEVLLLMQRLSPGMIHPTPRVGECPRDSMMGRPNCS